MRRFTGLLALGAILLNLASAQAQQTTYQYTLNFQTTNQSMWTPDIGTAGFRYTLPLLQSWNTNGPKGSKSYRNLSFSTPFGSVGIGTFGAAATVNTAGQVGLILEAIATSGSVDVQGLNHLIRLTAPDPATLVPGQTFTLSSAYTPGSLALATHSPDVGVSVGAILKADPMQINLNIKAFSQNILNNDILNQSFDLEHTLLDTRSLTSKSRFALYDNLLTGSFHLPVVETSATSSGRPSVSSFGQDPFLTFKADFSNVLAKLLDLPPFSERITKEKEKKFGPVKIKFKAVTDYSYLDLFGEMPLALAQNFVFTPHPTITLTLSNGQTLSFEAGQSVQLTMPADGSPLTITPTVALTNQFRNTTRLSLGAGIKFTPADLKVKFKISKATLADLHVKPLPTYDLISSTFLDVPIFDQTFDLGGFAPQALQAFTLAPLVATPLSAHDDTFTAINQGDFYTLHVPAPGVLANDSGPSGFTAVPQFIQLDGNATTYNTFTLNSDGSLDYVRVAGPGQEDFAYQITDGQGHTSTATIHIVRP